MVFIDDVITLVATVTTEEEQEIAFEVKAVNQAGKAVLKGDVTFVKTNG